MAPIGATQFQGNFFLFQEELPEAAAENALVGLVDFGTYEVPLSIWRDIERRP